MGRRIGAAQFLHRRTNTGGGAQRHLRHRVAEFAWSDGVAGSSRPHAHRDALGFPSRDGADVCLFHGDDFLPAEQLLQQHPAACRIPSLLRVVSSIFTAPCPHGWLQQGGPAVAVWMHPHALLAVRVRPDGGLRSAAHGLSKPSRRRCRVLRRTRLGMQPL